MTIHRKYIEKELRAYQKLFGLQDWNIKIGWNMDDGEDSGEAECASTPEYFSANIHFNLNSIKTKKAVREVVVHELFHVVLSEYTNLAKRLVDKKGRRSLEYSEERLVSTIERWKMWKKL